jgi:hypothetical protein
MSVDEDTNESTYLLPTTVPEYIPRPLDNIEYKNTMICQPHGFLIGPWKRRGQMAILGIARAYARRNDVDRPELERSSKYAETSPCIPASVHVADKRFFKSRLTKEGLPLSPTTKKLYPSVILASDCCCFYRPVMSNHANKAGKRRLTDIAKLKRVGDEGEPCDQRSVDCGL